jgi:hypothetical protein
MAAPRRRASVRDLVSPGIAHRDAVLDTFDLLGHAVAGAVVPGELGEALGDDHAGDVVVTARCRNQGGAPRAQ